MQIWGINKIGLIAVDSDAGVFIYCPKKHSKCPGGGGREISLGKPIRVPAGKFLRYEAGHVLPVRNERPSLVRPKNGAAW